jgi:ABC-type molybdate transport system ATPase subunit
MLVTAPRPRRDKQPMHPQDIELLPHPEAGATEALVRRLVQLDAEVRVELTLPDGAHVWTQVTASSAHELELEEGQILMVRLPTQPASA